MFAGLIDVQDRMLFNRSYTTGPQGVSRTLHGRDRQRDRLGQSAVHHVLYAGALDIAVGPRWYSTYEMACNW